MTRLEKLNEQTKELRKEIVNFLKFNNLKFVQFNTMFQVTITESNTYDDFVDFVPCFITKMDINGIFYGTDIEGGDMVEVPITDLNITECAYILDMLENNEYTPYDPEDDDEEI